MSESLVHIDGLKKHFIQNSGLVNRLLGNTQTVRAVDGVSFDINRGETFGLVGESGSGKSTTARALVRLDEPTEGEVRFDGEEMGSLSDSEMKALRRRVQMVFQDPASSLNRRKTVSQLIKQPMKTHDLHKGNREERVDELLETVGLSPEFSNRYPHEFSGGQQQRIGIARALSVEPELLVCDEPVSALDVSIQAQILNLLNDLQTEFDLTILFIAHDLSVIRHVCDRVAVMYLGEIMEIGPTEELFANPKNPYTMSLLRSIPEVDPSLEVERESLEGEVPSPINPPSGCSFHTRCPQATEECAATDPALAAIDGSGETHFSACHYVSDFEDGLGIPIEEDREDRYGTVTFKRRTS
jgi:peptide/nickel transport system ATP-binding protein/oligopeptide transport system ATP-binding protein